MGAPNTFTDTGVGTIPEAVSIVGITIDTDLANTVRLIVIGGQVKNKTIYEGSYIFASNQLRKVVGFFPNGDILIDSPFPNPLLSVDLKRVKRNVFKEVSVINKSTTITGQFNNEDLLPRDGLEFRDEAGLSPILYNANSGLFKITTLTTI